MELEQQREALARAGYGLASISYDPPAVLADFARRRAIRFPLLADPGSRTIQAFGVLNETVPSGSPFSGIPHPVTFLIDRAGVVRARFHEDDYRKRYTLGGLLLREFDSPPAGPVHDVPAKRIKLRLAASAAEARPGQRITLMIEMDLRPGLHVYAPGVVGYRPVVWSLESSPAFTAHAVDYPPSRPLHLQAIDETVPVFENRVRLLRDVTIDGKAPPGELAITGTFQYQACDERICYPPETVPAAWKLQVAPHDRERSAASPRRKLQ